jgi:uncharacterized protein YndB with AHSA1/START domain
MSDRAGPVGALVIERIFDAPVEAVWALWTDPEQFAAWYGPNGASLPMADLDVRIGGLRRVCLEVQTPNGPMSLWFTGEYREIVDNRRLVYTESMSDEDGRILAPSDLGMSHDHPSVTEVVVELDDLDGRTRMTLTHRGVPADSPGATGWAMALDKLATLITTRNQD